jgi:hypothetical protein
MADERALKNISLLPTASCDKLSSLQVEAATAQDLVSSITARLRQDGVDAKLREKLEAERGKHQARAGQLAQVCSKLMQFLAEVPAGCELVPVELTVDLKPNEKLADQIASTRAEIADLNRKLTATKRAPLSEPERQRLVEEYAGRLYRQAQPKVSIVQDQLRVSWPSPTMGEDVGALLMWLCPDELIAALSLELKNSQPMRDGEALSASDRKARVHELQTKISDLEYREEALIERAAAGGTEIMRRIEASPTAILGITIASVQQQAVA